MNLDRYEKIEGCEALKRLADGKHVFSKAGVEYKLNQYGFLYYLDDVINDWKTSRIAFNQLVVQGFYIPKPFDVRQAMRDRPNEWVGAFKVSDESWWKFGFEDRAFQVVAIPIEVNTKLPLLEPYRKNGDPCYVSVETLDACIPIEDVPEEATR